MFGPTESVLVDTQYMSDDVDEVIRRIEATGTTLTTIYSTHAHADIPSLAAVIAGDVIYNGINPFLAASDPDGWRGWLESIAKVAELEPRIIVAGHKRPELPDDDITASLGSTSAYIRDFMNEVELARGSRDLVERMQRRYPYYGNPSALILSAVTALRRTAT